MRSHGTTLKRPLKMQRLFKSRIGTLREPLSIRDFIKDHLTANTPAEIPLNDTPIQLHGTVYSPKSIPCLEINSTESKQPFQVKDSIQHFLIRQQQTGKNSLICNLSVQEQLSTSNNAVKQEQENKRQAKIEERIMCIERALAQNFGNCNMIKSKYYSKRTKKNDSVSLCLKRQSRLSCVLEVAKPPQELTKIGSVDTLSSTHRRAFRKPSKQYYDIYLHEREEYSPSRMLLNKTSYSMDYPKKSVGICAAFKPIDNLGREGEFRKEGSQNGASISIYNKEHGKLRKGSPVSYDYTGMDCFRDKHTPINISFLSYSSKVPRGGKIKPSKEIRVSKAKENNVCSILSSFKTGYGYDISGRYRTETGEFGLAIVGGERAVTKDAQLSRLKNAYRFGMAPQFQ